MVGIELSASPVLPLKIRPSCMYFHPFSHHLQVLREKRELQSQPWGRILGLLQESVTSSASQMLSTAGRIVRTLLRLLRILEFLYSLTPLGVYILSIYRTRDSTDLSPKGWESLKHSGKGPLYRKSCSILQTGLLRFGFPQGNSLSLFTCHRLLDGPCGQETS